NNLGTTTAQIEAALKSNAVTGLITGLPAGTANRLLQTSFSNLLSAPVLSLPANTAINVSRNPTLSWGAVTGATAYNVQYSTSSTFGTGTTSRNGVPGNSLNITSLARRTKYFWRVQAVNGAWSSTWSFTTVR
ncbi:MAG: fibronectin type III domain-containing protein, partial [bacterium]